MLRHEMTSSAVPPDRSCPVCGERTLPEFAGLYDDRYGYPGFFDINRCRKCGHRHLGGRFDEPQLRKMYSEFYPRAQLRLEDFKPHQEIGGLRAWWNGGASAAFRWVPRDVRVLDIGCGLGQTLAYHQARGCDAHGVDADDNLLRFAERFGLKARAGLFDPSNYEPAFFDYVTLDQVLEHSGDPIEMLRGVARVVRPGGYVILTTPNPCGLGLRTLRRCWLHWHCPYHLQFFTRRSLSIAARAAGLQVVRRHTVTSSDWLYYQWLHLVTFPRPGEASVFWAGKHGQYGSRSLRRLIIGLHRLGMNHIATRMLDALGIGENQVFLLRRPA